MTEDYCKNCGHHYEEHQAWDKDELIMFNCSFDNPVCDCEKFVEITAKTEKLEDKS